MPTTTLSSDYQIVLPPQACAALGLVPGGMLSVIVRGDRLDLLPVTPMSAQRGFLRGKLPDSVVERNADRPL